MSRGRVKRRRLHRSLDERRAASLSGTSEGAYGPIWEGDYGASSSESLDALMAEAEEAIAALVEEYASLSRDAWIASVLLMTVGVAIALLEGPPVTPISLTTMTVLALGLVLGLRALALRVAVGIRGSAARGLVHVFYQSVRSFAPERSPAQPETLRDEGFLLLDAYVEGHWSFRAALRHRSVIL